MDNENQPLVSIITPMYNSARFISFTIESVLNQTYQNWEMIIVDDCSTDDSKEIVKRYMKEVKDTKNTKREKRIKLVELKENVGVSKARNKAIEIAQGKYIAFLDSDDLWKKNKLKKQINFMEDNNFSLSFSGYEKINERGEKLDKIIKIPDKINYKKLLHSNYIGCLTSIYNAEQLGKHYVDPKLAKSEDYELWLRIIKKAGYAYGIQDNLAEYRIVGNSLSSNKLNMLKHNWILLRDIEKLSLISALYCTSCNIFIKLFVKR